MKAFLIKPQGSMFFRESRPFDSPMSQKSRFMPFPSGLYGALRTAIGEASGIDWVDFSQGKHDERLKRIIGDKDNFGSLRLQLFLPYSLEIKEPLFPAPSDLILSSDNESAKPKKLTEGNASILKPQKRDNPYEFCCESFEWKSRFRVHQKLGDGFVSQSNFYRYLKNNDDDWFFKRGRDFFYIEDLAKWESRTGNEIDPKTGRTKDGQLYNLSLVKLQEQFSFFCQVDGDDGAMDKVQSILLGGEKHRCFLEPTKPVEIPGGFGNKMLLLSPTEFSQEGKALIESAALGLVENTVNLAGYDLVKNQPKPLRKMQPTGTVYWFENQLTNLDSLITEEDYKQGLGTQVICGGN